MSNGLLAAFLAACIVGAALLMTYGRPLLSDATLVAQSSQPIPTAMPAPPGAGARFWTPTPHVVVGGSYRLVSLDRIWVDELGLSAWKRADNNRDQKAQDRIDDAFDNYFLEAGTRVTVVSIGSGQLKHLEVTTGPHKGRRGWTDTYSDNQYVP